MEKRTVGKTMRSRRMSQMLTVFYENNSYEALKRSAKDISAWTESTRKKV